MNGMGICMRRFKVNRTADYMPFDVCNATNATNLNLFQAASSTCGHCEARNATIYFDFFF